MKLTKSLATVIAASCCNAGGSLPPARGGGGGGGGEVGLCVQQKDDLAVVPGMQARNPWSSSGHSGA